MPHQKKIIAAAILLVSVSYISLHSSLSEKLTQNPVHEIPTAAVSNTESAVAPQASVEAKAETTEPEFFTASKRRTPASAKVNEAGRPEPTPSGLFEPTPVENQAQVSSEEWLKLKVKYGAALATLSQSGALGTFKGGSLSTNLLAIEGSVAFDDWAAGLKRVPSASPILSARERLADTRM